MPLPSVRFRFSDATVVTLSTLLGWPGHASSDFPPVVGAFLATTHGLPRSAAVTIAFFSAAASSALVGVGVGVGVLAGALALASGGAGGSDPPQPTPQTKISTADPAAAIALRMS